MLKAGGARWGYRFFSPDSLGSASYVRSWVSTPAGFAKRLPDPDILSLPL